jgi:hypothetical protein
MIGKMMVWTLREFAQSLAINFSRALPLTCRHRHHYILLYFDNQLFQAPIGDNPQVRLACCAPFSILHSFLGLT